MDGYLLNPVVVINAGYYLYQRCAEADERVPTLSDTLEQTQKQLLDTQSRNTTLSSQNKDQEVRLINQETHIQNITAAFNEERRKSKSLEHIKTQQNINSQQNIELINEYKETHNEDRMEIRKLQQELSILEKQLKKTTSILDKKVKEAKSNKSIIGHQTKHLEDCKALLQSFGVNHGEVMPLFLAARENGTEAEWADSFVIENP